MRSLPIWLAVGALALSGCATLQRGVDGLDLLGHNRRFEKAQLDYTQLVRWGEYETAAHYVDPELREDFLALTRSLSDLRFSDYHVGPVDMNDGLSEATVRVSYRAFALDTLLEHTFFETQAWHRSSEHGWVVRPDLGQLRGQLAAGNL